MVEVEHLDSHVDLILHDEFGLVEGIHGSTTLDAHAFLVDVNFFLALSTFLHLAEAVLDADGLEEHFDLLAFESGARDPLVLHFLNSPIIDE